MTASSLASGWCSHKLRTAIIYTLHRTNNHTCGPTYLLEHCPHQSSMTVSSLASSWSSPRLGNPLSYTLYHTNKHSCGPIYSLAHCTEQGSMTVSSLASSWRSLRLHNTLSYTLHHTNKHTCRPAQLLAQTARANNVPQAIDCSLTPTAHLGIQTSIQTVMKSVPACMGFSVSCSNRTFLCSCRLPPFSFINFPFLSFFTQHAGWSCLKASITQPNLHDTRVSLRCRCLQEQG